MSRAGFRARERFWNLIFPARCLLCGEKLSPGGTFCEGCRKKVPESPMERRYSLPGSGAEGLWIIAPMEYQGDWRHTLFRFKFRGKRALAVPVGRVMAEALKRSSAAAFDCVTWAPMTAARRRKRGYDQSELLARSAARELGLPCVPMLEKKRNTRTQHELTRQERERNVKNAYGAEPGARGKRILLVDDIVTTGATLCECAETLYRAGAESVLCLCAADAQLQ